MNTMYKLLEDIISYITYKRAFVAEHFPPKHSLPIFKSKGYFLGILMIHLKAMAKAHYREGSERTKEHANRFSHGMPKDSDGKVDYAEFNKYLISTGHDYYAKRDLFNRLASNGLLGFRDIMTLYYIIASRRPFCNKCDKFLVGDYFACARCFESSGDPYCICVNCFRRPGTDFKHGSCDRPNFLDNCTTLAGRLPAPQPRFEHPHRHTDSLVASSAFLSSEYLNILPAYSSVAGSAFTSQSSQHKLNLV